MWLVWTTLLGFVVLVLLSYLEKKHKRAGVYTQTGICYQLKRLLAWVHFRFVRARRAVRVHSRDVLQPVDYLTNGYVPRPEDVLAEQVKLLDAAQASNTLSFYGCNSVGHSLLVRLVRRPGRQASLVLVLTVGDDIYQLPGNPDTTVYNTGVGWRAEGLRLECVVPMRVWRVTYRGHLRRSASEDSSPEIGAATCSGALVLVHLSFLWRPLAAPMDLRDCDTGLLVRAVARELWTPEFLSLMTAFSLDGYVQFGCLHGHVQVGSAPATEVRLRGPRLHRWTGEEGAPPVRSRHRALSLQARTADGSMLWIQADSWRDGITHLVYGVYVASSLHVHPLSDCSLSLPDLGEEQHVPTAFNIQFSAGGQSHTMAFISQGPARTMYEERPWRWMVKLQLTRVCLDDAEGFGVAEFGYRYSGECPLREETSLPLLVSSPLPNSEAPSIVDLEDSECRCEPLVGGKAASLALMAGMELADGTVPPAVVVSAVGWRRHLRRNPQLRVTIEDLVRVAGDRESGDLDQACCRAVEAIQATPVSEEIATELATRMRRRFGNIDSVCLAVRSSALGEDGEEMSAAGQNDTVLGCRGLQQVLSALTRCWASMFSRHSVEYRRQRGQHAHPGMAVVVQLMVASEASGVMFTRDPVTGDPTEVTITASYGLGEAVVSAMIEPDTIKLSRSFDDRLTVSERHLGSKRLQIVMTEDGGTEERDVAAASSCEGCLSDENALRLGRLGVHLEKAFGAARDVEWAIADGRVYLLQSRPVTSDHGWSEFELTHECDSALLTDDMECFTTANTGEVLPGAVTPITRDLLTYPFALATHQIQTELLRVHKGALTPAYAGQLFSIVHGRCMMNYISLFQSLLKSEAPDPTERAQELTVAGHLLDVGEQRNTAIRRHGTLNLWERLGVMSILPVVAWKYERVADDLKAHQGAFSLRLDHLNTAQQAYRFLCSNLMELQHAMGLKGHMFTSTAGNTLQTMLLILLHENGTNEWDEALSADFALLLSSCTGAESADVPAALQRLSELIAAAEGVDDFLSAPPEQALQWLKMTDRFVVAAYEDFINTHGHRGPNELELYSSPWVLDPAPLVATLQTMVRSANTQHVSRRAFSEEEAISQLRLPLTSFTKQKLGWVLPAVRRSVVLREQTKSLLVRVLHQFRLLMWHLGTLMVREGRLPDGDLVFFMSLYELQRLLDTRSPALVVKSILRRRLHPKLCRLRFPEMVHGIPRPLTFESSSTGSTGDLVVRGTPVCHGRVQGIARVVVNIADATQIQRDDILVTHATDIGWSPYFPLVAGVVTELGGLISHGAVVAREYGLPCVVGATGATLRLVSGDLVELDGTRGTVTRLESAESDDTNNMVDAQT